VQHNGALAYFPRQFFRDYHIILPGRCFLGIIGGGKLLEVDDLEGMPWINPRCGIFSAELFRS